MLAQFMKISKASASDKLQETGEIPEWAKATIAMRYAVAEVIEEHCKTGHPLIVWRDGKVYRQPPEEAKHELEQAAKSELWEDRDKL